MEIPKFDKVEDYEEKVTHVHCSYCGGQYSTFRKTRRCQLCDELLKREVQNGT